MNRFSLINAAFLFLAGCQLKNETPAVVKTTNYASLVTLFKELVQPSQSDSENLFKLFAYAGVLKLKRQCYSAAKPRPPIRLARKNQPTIPLE